MRKWFARSIVLASACMVAGGALGTDRRALEFHDANGGWGALPPPADRITDAEQQANFDTVRRNIAVLQLQGRLPPKAATPVRFAWPTRAALGRPEFHDHGVTNYIDQDPAVNSVRDYHCGTRTYDTANAGGGHKGTDIGIGLRGFYKMDTEQVIVVAAADGTIVQKDDTHPDRSCGDLSVLFADNSLKNNVIALRHADGTITYYYHVKTGSLTPKAVGDTVVEGEYLAAVGSAGFSSGPHLHFEVRTAGNAVVDPWFGACNPAQPASWWKEQEPYVVQEIQLLMPTSTKPALDNLTTACFDNVAANEGASGYLQPDPYAQPGVTHYFAAFVRDIDAGDEIRWTLKRPNGSTYTTASFAGTGGFVSSGYAYISRTISASEPAGKWTFEATYGGKTKSVPFYFNVARPAAARVYEFYNEALDHYFRTAVKAEADSLTSASGFLPTGDDYFALDASVSLAGVQPVCRFYGSPNPGPNSHFYTAQPAECQALKDIQARTPSTLPRWNFEENAFAAYLPTADLCPSEAPFPVYRLYNRHHGEVVNGVREDSNHRFTTFSSVFHRMAGQGWNPEGVVMCSSGKP